MDSLNVLDNKGFSLFTPLVGTAVVIVAMLVGVTMMQNSARVSESLSNSYSASAQSLGSKYIDSLVRNLLIDSLENKVSEKLKNHSFQVLWQQSDSDITSKIKWSLINDLKGEIGREIYSNFLVTLKDVISGSNKYTLKSNVGAKTEELSIIISRINNPYSVTFTSGGEIKTELNKQNFKPYQNNFTLKFSTQGKNEVKTSILPTNFTYTTEKNLQKKIEEASKIYNGTKNCKKEEDFKGEAKIYIKKISSKKEKKGVFTWNSGNINITLYSADVSFPSTPDKEC